MFRGIGHVALIGREDLRHAADQAIGGGQQEILFAFGRCQGHGPRRRFGPLADVGTVSLQFFTHVRMLAKASMASRVCFTSCVRTIWTALFTIPWHATAKPAIMRSRGSRSLPRKPLRDTPR